MKNILAVVAYPDDLEVMAGGSVAKWKSEGKNIHVLVFTNGSWISPDGNLCRPIDDIQKEVQTVKQFMGYDSYDVLNEETLNLQFKDSLVCEVLQRINKYSVDTILTSWEKDTHHDHRIANEIATSASRRVPNFLVGQINYYLKESFAPNFYVDISKQWETKIECLSKFESQWNRSRFDWTEFLDVTSRYHGKVVGCERAEGFQVYKYII